MIISVFLCLEFYLFFGVIVLIKKALLGLIRFYKIYISPLLPNMCKFYPTCSQYFSEALIKYGVIKGGAMGIWRILRCNPISKGGFDPLP